MNVVAWTYVCSIWGFFALSLIIGDTTLFISKRVEDPPAFIWSFVSFLKLNTFPFYLFWKKYFYSKSENESYLLVNPPNIGFNVTYNIERRTITKARLWDEVKLMSIHACFKWRRMPFMVLVKIHYYHNHHHRVHWLDYYYVLPRDAWWR